jgi:hypothetical protein
MFAMGAKAPTNLGSLRRGEEAAEALFIKLGTGDPCRFSGGHAGDGGGDGGGDATGTTTGAALHFGLVRRVQVSQWAR